MLSLKGENLGIWINGNNISRPNNNFISTQCFGSYIHSTFVHTYFYKVCLCYTSGIWGSAFCIQIKRLLHDDKKVDQLEALEQEREELGKWKMVAMVTVK